MDMFVSNLKGSIDIVMDEQPDTECVFCHEHFFERETRKDLNGETWCNNCYDNEDIASEDMEAQCDTIGKI